MTTKLYVIIADGAFDQVCETEASAKKEKRDLQKMGCEVKIKPVANWEEADKLETKMRGY